MSVIIMAVVSVTVIGIACAILLIVASHFMYVKVDERVAQLDEIMPGANCGACGYAGCSGYSKALIEGKTTPDHCPPGGAALVAKISAILGIEGMAIEKKTAVVHCVGDSDKHQKKMEYKGIKTCAGAKQLFGGESSCAFGCLSFGDCQIVCPANAICMEKGLARIMTDLCIGCGLCVKACPNKIITIEDSDIPVVIACKNIEKGAVVRKKCSAGCIACTKCVKECSEGAITMVDNLAVIDYDKCSGCGKCVDVCMTGCIKRM